MSAFTIEGVGVAARISKIEHNEPPNFPPPERDDYDPTDDFARSIDARVAAGGEPWKPKWER